eukprot:m.47212 g.47212  ORF g.47212 m.47212 type:complete len:89 (+) comp10749_c0_seq1:41-307(+)
MVADFHVFEVIAGSLGVVGASLVFLTFLLLPRFRRHPSEIIFFVTVSDFFLVRAGGCCLLPYCICVFVVFVFLMFIMLSFFIFCLLFD